MDKDNMEKDYVKNDYIKNSTKRCPYCSRKINYGVRLLEHNKGEHTCNHCNKISNIKQNSLIWIIMIICCLVSLLIMIFYMTSSKSIQDTFDDTGKMKFFIKVFFGDFMYLKWVLWETFPFIVFFFVSPLFIEYYPQKKFMEQTQTSIDLTVPLTKTSSVPKVKTDSRTRSIPKTKSQPFSGEFEDISSSSSSDIEKTRAFSVTTDISDYYKDVAEKKDEVMMDINVQKKSTSRSYSSDAPLIKVSHEQHYVRESSLQDDDIREYVPTRQRSQEPSQQAKERKNPQNYSANRRF